MTQGWGRCGLTVVFSLLCRKLGLKLMFVGVIETNKAEDQEKVYKGKEMAACQPPVLPPTTNNGPPTTGN